MMDLEGSFAGSFDYALLRPDDIRLSGSVSSKRCYYLTGDTGMLIPERLDRGGRSALRFRARHHSRQARPGFF